MIALLAIAMSVFAWSVVRTLGVLAAKVGMTRWPRRIAFMALCVIVPILANGVRAWGVVAIAQVVGAERAGGIDHIVYGWFFFAIVVALVMALGWRWFDRDPEAEGLGAVAMADRPAIAALDRFHVGASTLAPLLAAAGQGLLREANEPSVGGSLPWFLTLPLAVSLFRRLRTWALSPAS